MFPGNGSGNSRRVIANVISSATLHVKREDRRRRECAAIGFAGPLCWGALTAVSPSDSKNSRVSFAKSDTLMSTPAPPPSLLPLPFLNHGQHADLMSCKWSCALIPAGDPLLRWLSVWAAALCHTARRPRMFSRGNVTALIVTVSKWPTWLQYNLTVLATSENWKCVFSETGHLRVLHENEVIHLRCWKKLINSYD